LLRCLKKAEALPRGLQQLLVEGAAELAAALALDSNSARLEVQYLLQHVLNKPRAWLLAYPETTLSPEQQANYEALVQRRAQGEPIAYILGEREFFGLSFKVTPDTLIPRPETELLVDLALQRISSAALPQAAEDGLQACRGDELCILDLGAGSGAIALSIAHARPNAEVVAVDASSEALKVARENAVRLNIRNATFMHSNWYAALGQRRFHLIISNPPYVAAGDPHLHQGDLRFEPSSALVSGTDGLDDIRRIVAGAQAHLEPGGWLLLEHGYDQAAQVRESLRNAGLSEVFSALDLAGIERVSGGRYSKSR
jgi:release factor glutamine methyltransferase